jgi:hypothetical protein
MYVIRATVMHFVLGICSLCVLHLAKQSKAGTVYNCLNIGIAGLNLAWVMDVCPHVCVVLSCVGRSLVSG